jgi:hypothetical protein
MTQQTALFILALPPETKSHTHPFTRLSPRGPIKDPSVPTELGQIPTLDLTASSLHRPEMLPANSCIPRCQRRAPELRVDIDSLEARRSGLVLHGIGLASVGFTVAGPTLLTPNSRFRRTDL